MIVGSAEGGHYVAAFRWEGGVMKDLGHLGGEWSEARGVNADGSVIVGWSQFEAGNENTHAFRWTREGGMVDLGTLGGDESEAHGVNADGLVVVGWSEFEAGNETNHAFRWEGGVIKDLGTLGGGESEAYGVNADGSVVVGWSQFEAGNENTHAFRWTEATGMQNLNTLLANAGVDMTGIILEYARAVSDNGEFIVGSATFPEGRMENSTALWFVTSTARQRV